MFSLGVINEFIGMPPNASEHGYQIDHIIEFEETLDLPLDDRPTRPLEKLLPA